MNTPQVLKLLVAWPKTLRRFRLKHTYRRDYSEQGKYGDWCLGVIADVLVPYGNFLTHLDIGGLQKSGLQRFKTKWFPSLQVLRLSYSATGIDKSLVGNLIAPQLKVFEWDLRREHPNCIEEPSAFGDAHEEWLLALTKAAFKQDANLRQISVRFRCIHEQLSSFYRTHQGRDGYGFCPWPRLYRISKQSAILFYFNNKLVDEDDSLRLGEASTVQRRNGG